MLAESLKRGTELAFGELDSLRDWYPVGLDDHLAQAQPTLWWRYLGQRRLTEAFFEDSFVGQSPQDRRVCRTPLAALDDLPEAVPPTAFIFHVSRCGSTLLTQMLATLPHCIVASEPPVLDAFFWLHHHSPQRSGGDHTLRQLVAALGQRRSGETHLFIKLDSWHMPWLPWLRNVFPGIPCLLLYRDPSRVLASHRRQRGAHMVPGLVDLSRLQLSGADLAPGDLDGFGVRVLAGVFRSALAHATTGQPGLTLMNYPQLPSALWTHLLTQWGVPCSARQALAMQSRAAFHAKHAGAVYAGDPAAVAGHLQTDSGALDAARADYAALESLRQPL